jgi:uncharacterized protein YkwD
VLIIGVTVWGAPAFAQEPICAGEALLQLINQARSAPLATAEALGQDPDQILADFPDMANELKNGFKPLSLNAMLTVSARDHNQDMVANGYYGSVSPDGGTAAERISSTGYKAVQYGETLGKLTFVNFIKPEKAAQLIFQKMFLDELDPAYTGQRNILQPEFEDVGIDVGTGDVSTGDSVYHYYVVTCDFGAKFDSEKRMALQLVELINQARAFPLVVADGLGVDSDSMLRDLPDLDSYFFTGMPPLAVSDELTDAARSATMDLITDGNADWTSLDERDLKNKLAAFGYEACYTALSAFTWVSDTAQNPDAAVSELFKRIYGADIDPSKKAPRVVLNQDLEDIGIWLDMRQETLYGKPQFVYTGVVLSATRTEWNTAKIVGTVYQDLNGDGLYSPGEELAGETLTFTGGENFVTDEAGFFQVAASPGVYQLSLIGKDGQLIKKEVDLDFDNKRVNFFLDGADE